MRPGTKVRLWSPKFSHRPDVEPPAMLRFVAALSVFSVVGVLVYSIAVALAVGGGGIAPLQALYVAVLHFVLPVGVFYTVNVNSSLSRPIISVYAVVLSTMTSTGHGVLGKIDADPPTRIAICAAVCIAVLSWLYGSPRMRFYYASLTGKGIPDDLVGREKDLVGGVRLPARLRRFLEWFVDHGETLVLVGFILLAVYAVLSMSV